MYVQVYHFAKVFDRYLLGWQIDLKVLCDDRDQEAGEGVGRLAKDMADEAL